MALTANEIFILGIPVSLAGLLIAHRFARGREIEGRRRGHKAKLRAIAAAFPPDTHVSTIRMVDEWWLGAIDDYTGFRRKGINRLIADFRAVAFPVPDWDVNMEAEYTPDKTEPYRLKSEKAVRDASAILKRIIDKS